MATTYRDDEAQALLLEQAAAGFRAEAERMPPGALKTVLTLLAEDPRRDLGDVIKTAIERAQETYK